jgi:hypothetical protein
MAKRRNSKPGLSLPQGEADNAIGRRQFMVAATSMLASVNFGACSEGIAGASGTIDLTINGLDPSAANGGTAVASPTSGGSVVNITIPAAGHQTALVPVGDYTVTYTAPNNHSLAPGQPNPRTVSVQEGATTAITVDLIATGTISITITGLSGSPPNGGSVSAQRTDAAGSPITINLSAAGTGSAPAPAGTYTLTYTPPSGFQVTSTNPVTGKVVAVGQAATQTFTVQAIVVAGTGTLQVTVTGLTGSPANGGSCSAQRTDAAGSPVTINVSAGGSGSSSVPSGTYTVTYTPPGGFSTTTTNPLTGVVVANGGTGNANFGVQAVVAGAALFSSDWSTGLGTTDAALRDTSKALSWNIRGGEGTEVIAATGLDLPTTNALRVTVLSTTTGYCLLRRTGLPIPAVGQSRFYRWYFRLAVRDNLTDGDTHPVQDGNSGGDCNWKFDVLHNDGGPGLWRPRFTVGPSENVQNYLWKLTPTLQKNVSYRFEVQILRIGTTTFNMHIRVYNSANVLIHSDADFRNEGSGVANLGLNPTFNFHVLNNLDGFNAGNNGLGGNEWFPSAVYAYQAGFAVKADDWCGPYAAGI